MECRICLETISNDNIIKNICDCKNIYFHEQCALKWFSEKIEGVSNGKLNQRNWKTQWFGKCEVCNQSLPSEFVNKCVKSHTYCKIRLVQISGVQPALQNYVSVQSRQRNSWNVFACFQRQDQT